ncbi:Pentatricopeptide repeat-containing protein At5g39350 [Linum grandiflorum]
MSSPAPALAKANSKLVQAIQLRLHSLANGRQLQNTSSGDGANELPGGSVLRYNKIMNMHAKNGSFSEVLHVFVEMRHSGSCLPDAYSYPSVAKACSELSLLRIGRVVHAQTFVSALGYNPFVQNSLMSMYMRFGEKEVARKVFDVLEENKTAVSWNILINGYFKNRCPEIALAIFDEMIRCQVELESATVVSVLPACGWLKKLEVGRKVHMLVKEKGLDKKIEVCNALVDMYSKCGSMEEAKMVFDGMAERDVITWTSMINGYILNGDARGALDFCRAMQNMGIRPNFVTVALLLSACASLNDLVYGRCIHGLSVRLHLDSTVEVETSLIDMYAKCHHLNVSFEVLRRSSRKRIVPCNAVLSGCVHNNLAVKAVRFFKNMLSEGVRPDSSTLNCLLPAYSDLADLPPAENIHCFVMRLGFLSQVEVATCLMDIYSKCGVLESAHRIFNDVPTDAKDIFVWSVIIAGYGTHGHGQTAVSLFRQMVDSGIEPNEVTFTSVLHACSHAGLVDEGLNLFNLARRDFRARPNDSHYTCIVDLLGRAGRLEEAYDIVRTMPGAPSHAVWGALLGACVIHQQVELGELAAASLFQLEPENTGNYILLGKLYAAAGRWQDAETLRELMNDTGLRKESAYSLIGISSA